MSEIVLWRKHQRRHSAFVYAEYASWGSSTASFDSCSMSRCRGKHPFLGVYLQIKGKVFFSYAILCKKTRSEEIFWKNPFLAVCRPKNRFGPPVTLKSHIFGKNQTLRSVTVPYLSPMALDDNIYWCKTLGHDSMPFSVYFGPFNAKNWQNLDQNLQKFD